MKKISVIIPVYNTEKYIDKCINSVLQQDLETEIIVVNDGSTDNSKKIIEKYRDKIIYLEKENGGLSDARNYGLKYATGEYVAFLDSDDFIEKDLFLRLEKYIEKKIDIIKFKIKLVDEYYKEIRKIPSPSFECVNGEKAFENLFGLDEFLEVSCGYLYRKEFFKENNFHFEKGMYHEDFGLIPLVILKAKTVISLNIYGYNYLQTQNSITRNLDYSKTLKRANDVLAFYDNMIKKIESYEISQTSKKLIKEFYTNAILNKAKTLNKKDRKIYISKLKNRKIVDNIQIRNVKQLIKKIILKMSINLYLHLIDCK